MQSSVVILLEQWLTILAMLHQLRAICITAVMNNLSLTLGNDSSNDSHNSLHND